MSSVLLCQSNRKRSALEHLKKAKSSYFIENLIRAEKHLDTAIAYYATLQEAYLLRGQIHEEKENFRKAIIDYKSLITLNKEHREGWFSLGNAFFRTGNFNEAINSFNTILASDAQAETQAVYYELNATGSTRSISTQTTLDKVIYNMLGLCYLKLEKYEVAINSFNKALSFDPAYSDALVNLGLLYEQVGDEELSLEYFKEAFEVDSENEEAYYNFFRFSDAGDHLEQLNEVISEGIESPRLYNERGIIFLEKQQYKSAKTDFEQAVKIDSQSANYWYNLGLANHNLSEYEQAIKNYQKSLNLSPDFKKAVMALGNTFNKSGQYTEAINTYSKVLIMDADNGSAYYNRAIAFFNLKNTSKACNDFLTSFELGVVAGREAYFKICEDK